MPTLYITQVGTALEAELAAKNELIARLEKENAILRKQRDLIKTKWEDLMEEYRREKN